MRVELEEEFAHPRILAASSDGRGRDVQRFERVIIRDLDLDPHPPPDHRLDLSSRLSPGRIVAHVSFRYNPAVVGGSSTADRGPRTDERNATSTKFPPGANVELIEHFNSLVESTLHANCAGPATYEVRDLATLNSHHRRGLARQLLAWIFPIANQAGLPIVLAASPPGYPLYSACGFEPIRGLDGKVVAAEVDRSRWGGSGLHQHVLMVKWPHGSETEEQDVEKGRRSWAEWRKKNTPASLTEREQGK